MYHKITVAALMLLIGAAPLYAEARYQLSSSEKRWVGASTVDELYLPILFGVSVSDLVPDFGQPRGGGTRSHEGQDMMTSRGLPIVSPTKAIVTAVGAGESAGNFVYTVNSGGESFRYMHLDTTANIDVGDRLDVGDFIGTVGDTGNAPDGAYHLHFEIRNADNEALDPYPRLTKEFTLKQKIEYLDGVFDSVRNDEFFANLLLESYPSDFILALEEEYDLPRELAEAIKDKGLDRKRDVLENFRKVLAAIPVAIIAPVREGDSGTLVTLIQIYLMYTTTGEARDALLRSGPTGYYGAITAAAVREYQEAEDLPVTGTYDSRTRAHMLKHSIVLNLEN